MSPTYDNEARSQENRGTQDSLDAVAENALGLINQAAAQANENIKTAYASAQRLSANLDAAKARIQELESVRHYYQERSERAQGGDEDLIKLSLSAAPEAVAKDATVVIMDHDGKMRTLRKGTGQWTCMPGHADPANPDPMCGDQNAMEWGMAWMNHKDPPANKVGFMYMLRGDGGASNTDPYATKEEHGNNWIKTGAHVMIVGSGAKMLDGYPRDAKADPTKPYVMWSGTQYEHLMLPVR